MATESKPMTASASAPAVKPGRFVWYDLMTTDIPAATAFYKKVAGWGTQDFAMGSGGTYQMWTVGDVAIGGVMQLTPDMGGPGTPPHWMAYVSVANVDESVKKVKSLGGKVHAPPMDIPTVGRFAVIADPQGAPIALFTPIDARTPPPYAPKVGEFSWHELLTSDHKAAFAFYSEIFNWEKQGSFDMGPMGEYLMYGQGGKPVAEGGAGVMYGGMSTKTPDMPMPPSWTYYIRVASADATVETVKSLGGKVLHGPMEVPGGDRIANCMDPQGAVFAVHSVKES